MLSWVVAVMYWDKLPSVIPVHFGFNGNPDSWAEKSLFYVLMLPVIQTIMLAVFAFIYQKPQYSNIPTTMWLTALDDKSKKEAYILIRNMNVGVLVIVSILLTYMTYGMNYSALNTELGLNPYILLTVVAIMLVWIIYWAIVINKSIKVAIKRLRTDNK